MAETSEYKIYYQDDYLNDANILADNHKTAESVENALIKLNSKISDKTFLYTQKESLEVWDINHNLNKYPSVTVIDSSGSEVIGEVEYIDKNNLKISFKGGFKGTATLN